MESIDSLPKDLLKILIRNELLKDFVLRECIHNKIKEINVKEDIYKVTKKNFLVSQKIANEDEFDKWLDENSLSRDSIERKLTTPIKISEYVKENFSHMAESYFLKNKENFDIVVYSLIRVKDFFNAKEIHMRINEGEADFGDIARTFSEGTEKETRGIIGPCPLTQAHPEIVNLLKKSKVGELSEILKLNEWYLILRLESLKSATLNNDMINKISKELFDKSMNQEANTIIKGLIERHSLTL